MIFFTLTYLHEPLVFLAGGDVAEKKTNTYVLNSKQLNFYKALRFYSANQAAKTAFHLLTT